METIYVTIGCCDCGKQIDVELDLPVTKESYTKTLALNQFEADFGTKTQLSEDTCFDCCDKRSMPISHPPRPCYAQGAV